MPYSNLGHNEGIPSDVSRKLRIEGHLPNLVGGGAWNDVWEGGDLVIPEPNSAGQSIQVQSSNINDTVAGTGVHSIKVYYLTTANLLLSEVVLLDGQNAVVLEATNITDIIDLHSTSVGSNIVAEGDITLTDVGNTSIKYGIILTGGNKSLSTLRHLLPTSKFYITDAVISGDTKGVDVMLRSDSTDDGEVYPNVWLFAVPITITDAPTPVRFSPALEIPATARIKLSARGSANATISSFLNGWVKI